MTSLSPATVVKVTVRGLTKDAHVDTSYSATNVGGVTNAQYPLMKAITCHLAAVEL